MNIKIITTLVVLSTFLYSSVGTIKQSANLRDKPSMNSNIIGTLYKNDKVNIVKKIKHKDNGTWYQLDNGFVFASLVGFGEVNYKKIEDISAKYNVTASALTIRKYPLLNTKILGKYKQNTIIESLALYKDDKNNTWMQTKDGFVFAKYLEKIKTVEKKIKKEPKVVKKIVRSKKYSSLVNAVALVVNDSIITLYDIDVAMQTKNISNNQAIAMLIDEVLYTQELDKFDIVVEEFELQDYVSKIATSNNLNLDDFKKAVEQQQEYKIFLEDTKKRLLKQKLISKIAFGKLKMANDDDIKMYYDNNIDSFRVDKNSIQVVPLEQVKNKIFNVIMGQREQKFLKEYFETLKITADIKIVR